MSVSRIETFEGRLKPGFACNGIKVHCAPAVSKPSAFSSAQPGTTYSSFPRSSVGTMSTPLDPLPSPARGRNEKKLKFFGRPRRDKAKKLFFDFSRAQHFFFKKGKLNKPVNVW